MGLELFVFLTLLNLNVKIACVRKNKFWSFEVYSVRLLKGSAGLLLKFVVWE